MITAPLWPLLGIWLGTVIIAIVLGATAAWCLTADRAARHALDELEQARPDRPEPITSRSIDRGEWEAWGQREPRTEPVRSRDLVPVVVLEEAIRNARGQAVPLGRAQELAEREIRRLAYEGHRQIGPPR